MSNILPNAAYRLTISQSLRWGISRGLVVIFLAALATAARGQTSRPQAPIPNLAAFGANDEFPKLSPFSAVRWRGDVAQVQYKGTWYQLDSVNDLSVSDIMTSLKEDFAPQKHFAEDLVEVLSKMGHKPGDTVKLDLKTLDTSKEVVIADAQMTEANRLAVMAAGNGAAPPQNAGLLVRVDGTLAGERTRLQQQINAINEELKAAELQPRQDPAAINALTLAKAKAELLDKILSQRIQGNQPTSRTSFPTPYLRVSIVDGQFVIDQLNIPDAPVGGAGRGGRGGAALNTITDGDRVIQIRYNPDGTLNLFRITRTLETGVYRLQFTPSPAGIDTIVFQKQAINGVLAVPSQLVSVVQKTYSPNAQIGLGQPTGVTVTVADVKPDPAGGRANTSTVFEDHANTFAELREKDPKQVEQYVRPILEKLSMDYLLGPVGVEMVQVFSDVAIDPKLAEKMKPHIADLDSESPETREAASKQLADLGAPAIVILLRMDQTSLSPEQSARIVALCQGAKLLSDDEIASRRRDPAFLCQCVVSGPKPVRIAALEALKQVSGHDITINLDGTDDDRQRALEAIGLPPTSRP